MFTGEIGSSDLWMLVGVIFAALCLMLLSMRYAFKGPRLVLPGRVTGIVGRKGHGKSLFMVHELLRAAGTWQKCPVCTDAMGRKIKHRITVASNNSITMPKGNPLIDSAYGDGKDMPIMPVQGPMFRLLPDDPDELWKAIFDLPHLSLAFVDELGIYAPAESSFRLPKLAVHILGQCRKYVHEIIWSAQREDRVTVGVRSQTDLIGLCQRSWFKTMAVRFCEPEDLQLLRRRSQTKFKAIYVFRYRVTRKLGRAYNTFQRFHGEAETRASVAPPAYESERG